MERDGQRWLIVHAPGEPTVPIMLVDPRGVPMDSSIADEVRSLVATGFLGPGSLATDDCRATYAELKAKGVEFTEEPEDARWDYVDPMPSSAARAATS